MANGDPRHEEWSAALGARRELGPDYDEAFLQNLVERVSSEIDSRVEVRVAEIATTRRRPTQHKRGGGFLALASIALGIPLTAIAGDFAHTAGIAIVWGGIVLVNAARASAGTHGR
jgi:hypothetical protein